MSAITKEDLRAELERIAAGELGRTIAHQLCELVRDDVIKTLRSVLDTSRKPQSATDPAPGANIPLVAVSSCAEDETAIEAGKLNASVASEVSGAQSDCAPPPRVPRATLGEGDLGVRGAVDGAASPKPSTMAKFDRTSHLSHGSNMSMWNGTKRHHMNVAVQREAVAQLGHKTRSAILARSITQEASSNGNPSDCSWPQFGGAPSPLTLGEEVQVAPGDLRSLAQALVEHPAFDYATLAVIAANAVVIGLQTDDFASRGDPGASTPTVYRVLSFLFCVIFTLELLMRIAVYKLEYFTMPGWWHMNIFDFLLVVFQIFEEVSNASIGDSNKFDLSFLRILRLLNAVRVLRVARLLRFVRKLRMIVGSILRSGVHIFWTVLMLCIVIYILSVYLTDLVASFAHDDESLKLYFGSVGASVLTLYQAITGGLDWSIPSGLLSEAVSPAVSVGFCLYVGFVLFVLMNSVNGVFVEVALVSAQKNRDINLFHMATELFIKSDLDQDGLLTWTEFESQLGSTAMKKYFDVLDLDIAEAKTLFNLIDADNSGVIDTSEFVNGCFRLRGSAKGVEFASFLREFYGVAEMVQDMKNSFTEQLSMLEMNLEFCRGATQTILKRFKHQGPVSMWNSGDRAQAKQPSDDLDPVMFGEEEIKLTPPCASVNFGRVYVLPASPR